MVWQSLQADSEEEMKARISQAEAAAKTSDRRRDGLEQQNQLLHQQLEKMASQLPTGGERQQSHVHKSLMFGERRKGPCLRMLEHGAVFVGYKATHRFVNLLLHHLSFPHWSCISKCAIHL